VRERQAVVGRPLTAARPSRPVSAWRPMAMAKKQERARPGWHDGLVLKSHGTTHRARIRAPPGSSPNLAPYPTRPRLTPQVRYNSA